MTEEEIDNVLKKVRTWPKEKQEDAALMLLAMDDVDNALYELTPEEEADLDEALRELERGEIASAEEVAAVFTRSRG